MAKLETLIKKVLEFNKKHGWRPVPADAAKSIVIEAAELLEHFQWDESTKKKKRKNWEAIKLELADVLWYIIAFCHGAKIDLKECLEKKIQYNEEKYPEEMFQGKHNREFYLKQKRKYRRAKKK